MNRKFIFLMMLFFLGGQSYSQVSYSSWTNSYLQINSYQGNTNPDAYTMTIAGNGNFNIPHWRLSARLKSTITANSGSYIFPANKISFQPVSSTGQAYPNPIPTIAEIGIPPNTIVTEGANFLLIPQSNAPLYNQPSQPNGYYNLQIKFSIIVAGGAYLGNYPAWITFTAPIEFTAYDQNNMIIGKMDHQFQFQIGALTGTPPTSTELSLKVNGNASNGLLEFSSMQDYKDGKSVTYPNALTVKANTNFQITVKAIQNNFTSASGKTIPVSNVQMNLLPTTQNAGSSFNTVFLNTASQIIAKGSSTQGANLDYTIKYFTKPNDEYFINAKPDEYSATLQYEITPQ
ncbi:hypothetical protein [Chryseobacterium sp. 3008163]|uniref:hypothetical protein n=1 Tax=Chryseobacterium sp. 3008163 TaxID=2478663 RepID=UPI000F0C8BFA|nr:hypothetical protein [Chryseobacterium sp. 3008163]AYM99060.1 hypothetical protein EAG08_00735 [Chryseobacterium sp. 3008163]